MNISDLQPQFKRYAIHEKGITPKVEKSIGFTIEHLVDFIGTENIKKIDTETIREFLHHKREVRGWSPKTFRNQWQNMKCFFNWCVKKRYITENPADGIEKPKLPKRLPRCLTRDEAAKIIYHTAWHNWRHDMERYRNEAILCTFIMSGLRLSELLNLQVQDVNMETGEIFVRQGKGKKDCFIPIHPKLLGILRKYFSYRQKHGYPSKWFYTGVKSGNRLSDKAIQNVCEKISVESGIKFTPHMLRHTFARLSVDEDLNIYKLKELMGHADISTTQIYMSVSREGNRDSFNKVNFI